MTRSSYLLLALIWVWMLVDPANSTAAPQALVQAHAHNDYYHQRPLFDALERGFTSIEADVFLVDGELLVGHYEFELSPKRSLQALYLDPLRQHIKANRGRVFHGQEPLTLFVDFKTDGAAAYAALDRLLEEYDDMLSRLKDGKLTSGPVQVVVTGNRPIAEIASDKARRLAIDGRFADLKNHDSAELIPIVSESWTSHFTWRGQRAMPDDQRARLKKMVEDVHAQGRRLRFWATPDDAAVWSELKSAGVDLIGADDLEKLQRFLTLVPTTKE